MSTIPAVANLPFRMSALTVMSSTIVASYPRLDTPEAMDE